MDNFAALQSFWESFNVDAYDEETYFTKGDVPAFPHLTYESVSGTWTSTKMLSAYLWDRSPSWAWLKQKAEEIKKAIGSGRIIQVDDGALWLRIPELTPFAQSIPSDSEDDQTKRILLYVEVEFLTVR